MSDSDSGRGLGRQVIIRLYPDPERGLTQPAAAGGDHFIGALSTTTTPTLPIPPGRIGVIGCARFCSIHKPLFFCLDYTFYHNFFNCTLVFFICEPLRYPK
eukprot:COSAG01_NODE_1988_length_8706_cov_16.749506_7_plen_101_part_00